MNWYEEVSIKNQTNYTVQDELVTGFNIKKLKMNNRNKKVNTLAQFYMAKEFFSGTKNMWYIYIPDIETYNMILNDVAVHFENVKGLFDISGNVREVILNEINQDSKQLFDLLVKNNKIHPIICDLFNSNIATEEFVTVKRLKIMFEENNNFIDSSLVNSFIPTWNLIKRIYNTNNRTSVYILPNGWRFDNNLKNSFALNFFSLTNKEVIIDIDKNENVIGIDIVF